MIPEMTANATTRCARWAEVVQYMCEDCETSDVLVYGAGGVELSTVLGREVRTTAHAAGSQQADIVVCDGALDGLTDAEAETALDEIVRLIRRTALVIFPVGEPGGSGPQGKPAAWWNEKIAARGHVLLTRDIGHGEGLALVAPRVTSGSGTTAAPQTSERLYVPRVFIGTEPRMKIAETVLRHSIELNARGAVDIQSMDYSRGGVWSGWDIGRPLGQPATSATNANGNAVWFTDFTNYRWAIPEICGFEGRAIYADVDILVLGDVSELFTLPMSKPVLSLAPSETSVMLFDCEAFRTMPGWPTLSEMKTNGWGIRQYLQLLHDAGAFGELPQHWNCLDGRGYEAGATRLIHYTAMDSQPWRPYPDRLHYRPHACPEVENLWFDYAAKARASGCFNPPAEEHEAVRQQTVPEPQPVTV